MSVATPAGAALACQPSVSLTLQNNIQLNDPALAYYPIATGLKKPRHLAIDDLQNLLVVESGVGIMALTDTVACNGYEQRRLVDDTSLNTGIALHGTTLYASSEDNLYAWTYDSSAITVSDQHTVVSGMGGSTHGTRTIVLEPGNSPSYVILGRGSDGNLDSDAAAQNRSQIRRFPLAGTGTPLDWSQGELLADGIRNAVGMAIAPDAKSLYIVENSADNLVLPSGQSISATNPAEDVNIVNLNANDVHYGYPTCFTVWDGSGFPNGGKTTGSQFSIDSAVTDQQCEERFTAPRLSLPPHYAPLDIEFHTATNTSFDVSWDNNALVTSHGSWNSPDPVGYALLRVFMDVVTWQPLAPAASRDGYATVFAPPDLSACPGGCFRPVGVAVERGRTDGGNGVFVTSDTTGEIIRLYRGSPLATERSVAGRTRRRATGWAIAGCTMAVLMLAL